MPEPRPPIGLVGLGVMGRNLALNVADHGHPVVAWNRDPRPRRALAAEHPESGIEVVEDLAALVARLPRPRRILLMITAGPAVDAVLETLRPLLSEGDIVVDGGNSWFEDTRRREKHYRVQGFRFFGMGVSGGEEGARHGPSLMPGGDRTAYEHLAPVLEDVAAKTESGPCVTYVGSDGAGHFVKMVHNGIEYADMQLIAEAYDLLSRGRGLEAPALAETFARWNEGPLESFLIEITSRIFTVPDGASDRPLVEAVLDRAGQKGTGRWTVQVGLDLAVPVPTIAAALDGRVLSSWKDQREHAAGLLAAPPAGRAPEGFEALVHDALLAAKVVAYAQGTSLIARASEEYDWAIDLAEMARIWTGGCIIRARLLGDIRAAYAEDPGLANLLLAPPFRDVLARCQGALREVVGAAAALGIPVPALGASLAYYDAYRTARLPQNLTQAQRDAFGAHTYVRVDDPEERPVHTDWLGGAGG